MQHIFKFVAKVETIDKIQESLLRDGPVTAVMRTAAMLNADIQQPQSVAFTRLSQEKLEVSIDGKPEHSDQMIKAAKQITGLWLNMTIYYQYAYKDRALGASIHASQGRISPNLPLTVREEVFDTRYLGCEEDQMLL